MECGGLMLILGIESSCDETAAAVVENGRKIVSSVVATQIEKHKIFGGVVPEIASRMHTEAICAVTKQALSDANCKMSDIDAIAVTYAPGLIGALLVGVITQRVCLFHPEYRWFPCIIFVLILPLTIYLMKI